jgi:integrase
VMEGVNRKRGSVAPAYTGVTFSDVADQWMKAVAPNLSPATMRQRASYLKMHILPHFGKSGAHELDLPALQEFATKLRATLSRKSAINVLSACFTILDYAGRCGIRVASVKYRDLSLGSPAKGGRGKFLTRARATLIIANAPEPYHTLFSLAWCTGMRAGELLALTVADLDVERRTITVSKSSDDRTREIRQPKTPNSIATLPMPSALEATLRNYVSKHWKKNPLGLLFPCKAGTRPRSRLNVIRCGLNPVLKKLGLPHVGLHAFRHGIATELANNGTPLPALQAQMRHVDIRTTLEIYAHVIQQTQRDAMESAAIGTAVPIGTENKSQSV